MELRVALIRRIERLVLARGEALMPRAGLSAACFVRARLQEGGPASGSGGQGTVLALAGPGNNGGDALTAAAHLLAWGFPVQVVLPSGPDGLPADARRAHAAWREAGGMERATLPGDPPALVIDGLFGIGLNRPLEPSWQALVDRVNAWDAPVLALDVPSGLHAESGEALGRPIEASWTLSFIASAPGLSRGAGPAVSGIRHLDELGLDVRGLLDGLPPDGAECG